jgi:Uma2 family endonuclease
MSTTTPVTADQLLRMPDDGFRYELVAGEVRKMVPAVGGILHSLLGHHILQNGLGQVFVAETGFLLAHDPDTVRAPDIAFIHKNHIPNDLPEGAFWPGAPDLVVEIVSPSDKTGEVDDKVRMWLDAGVRMAWVVNPKWRNVTVYRSPTDIKVLTENDQLDGEDVVPGFQCAVSAIFSV